MAVYTYDASRVESIMGAMKRSRRWHCVAAGGVLLGASMCALLRPTWIFGYGEHARVWVLIALLVFFAGPLAETLWRWNSRMGRLEESLRSTRVEIFAEGVGIANARSVRRLARHEICRGEEVAWGLYVRTQHRYCWIFIPAGVAGFEDLKGELTALGIPIVPASIPPNWEEVIGGMMMAATIFCAIFAQSTRWLAVNLVIAVIAGVGSFFVLSANADNLPKMRWARFAVFLPAAMTVSMLWAALH